jgi:hypothetical protein
MQRKIFAALTSAAALVAFATIPVIAQATTPQLFTGGTLQQKAPLIMQGGESGVTTPLTFQAQDAFGAFTVQCKESALVSKITTDPGEKSVTAQIEEASFSAIGGGPCATDNMLGAKVDVVTNLQNTGYTPEAHWTLQIQQPEGSGKGETPGQITAHILPPPGGSIEVLIQEQNSGADWGTCIYTASSIQLMGEEKGAGNDVFIVEGTHQFKVRPGSSLVCSEDGTLEGAIQLEDFKGNGVVIDMT